jgi:hypothetical protein
LTLGITESLRPVLGVAFEGVGKVLRIFTKRPDMVFELSCRSVYKRSHAAEVELSGTAIRR